MTSERSNSHAAATHPFLESPEALSRFVETWEAGALPKVMWTHAAHVAIGACYALRYQDAAIDHMREGIRRHNDAVGTANSSTSGYHETLTGLWLGVVSRTNSGTTDPWRAAVDAVDRFGEQRDLHRLYYSFDVVKSVEARASWVAPDLEGPY